MTTPTALMALGGTSERSYLQDLIQYGLDLGRITPQFLNRFNRRIEDAADRLAMRHSAKTSPSMQEVEGARLLAWAWVGSALEHTYGSNRSAALTALLSTPVRDLYNHGHTLRTNLLGFVREATQTWEAYRNRFDFDHLASLVYAERMLSLDLEFQYQIFIKPHGNARHNFQSGLATLFTMQTLFTIGRRLEAEHPSFFRENPHCTYQEMLGNIAVCVSTEAPIVLDLPWSDIATFLALPLDEALTKRIGSMVTLYLRSIGVPDSTLAWFQTNIWPGMCGIYQRLQRADLTPVLARSHAAFYPREMAGRRIDAGAFRLSTEELRSIRKKFRVATMADRRQMLGDLAPEVAVRLLSHLSVPAALTLIEPLSEDVHARLLWGAGLHEPELLTSKGNIEPEWAQAFLKKHGRSKRRILRWLEYMDIFEQNRSTSPGRR